MITKLLFKNFNRKAIAIATAVVVWILVNQSITETKTIANVPIKVVNLPADKTISGLLPNGYISQRVTLTLSGSKDVVQELEYGDLEVHLDASTADSNDWVVLISKKNLVSLNPNLDLKNNINYVSHPEFIIKLSTLITGKVPILVKKPRGSSPQGYEFLDIWPEKLMQTVSGPKEEIQALKMKGLKLTLDLSKITKEELDAIKESSKNTHVDEITYLVPDKWKKIEIPFRHNVTEDINDPEAEHLSIDFLRTRLLPIGKAVPLSIYYPIKSLDKVNPSTQKLVESDHVHFKEGIALFNLPLYVKNVSRLFLDIIRDNLAIVVIAAPQSEREVLQWSIEVIDTKEMEDTYVAFVISKQKKNGPPEMISTKKEELLRKRFQEYMHQFTLYTADGQKLNLVSVIENGGIVVRSE